MPVEDRAADTWEPLIAIADAAGGHWPSSGRAACKALVAAAEAADEEQSLAVKLLGDIRQIFIDSGQSFLASNVLVRELHGIEDSPWADFGLTRRQTRLQVEGLRCQTGVQRGEDAPRMPHRAPDRRVLAVYQSAAIKTVRNRPSPGTTAGRFRITGRIDPSGGIHPSGERPGQALFSHDRTDTDGSPTGDATHPAPAEHTDTTPSAPPGAPTASTPGMTPRVERIVMKARDARSSPGFTPPAGSGRCDNCGLHIATQGHRDGCTRDGSAHDTDALRRRRGRTRRQHTRLDGPLWVRAAGTSSTPLSATTPTPRPGPSATQSPCHRCPALPRCRRWFDSLPTNRRPSGVVAGVVVGRGRTAKTRKRTAETDAEPRTTTPRCGW